MTTTDLGETSIQQTSDDNGESLKEDKLMVNYPAYRHNDMETLSEV